LRTNEVLLEAWRTGVGEPVPERISRRLAEISASGMSAELEEACGDRVYSLHIVPASGREYLNIYARDVTERRAAERELARVNQELEKRVKERTRELEETNEQLNAFCYSIAHDLKAPLRSQAAFATILEADFGAQLGEVGRSYARKIYDAAERQSRLVSDLLAHMSVTRAELPLEPVELRPVLEQVKTDLAMEVQDRKAVVEARGLDQKVLANSASLHLVLLNLVSNAVKFVELGQRPRVQIWAEPVWPQGNGGPPEKYIRLWVEDNGIGIPLEYRHKLFGVFQRLHNARMYPGTGIGLAIVKNAA
jgi:light-regulated signal transduction histidine kinase (bacteriophytochrome)